jgi:hypothetical protein
MKRKSVLIGVLLALSLALTFSAGQVYASTSCFSDISSHPYRAYICWMKKKGILTGIIKGSVYDPTQPVTRAQTAVFLKRLDDLVVTQFTSADTANLNSAKTYTDDAFATGPVLISAGFNNWTPFNSTDPLNYTYFSSQTQVTRTSIGSSFLSVNPDLPTVLYGHSLQLNGVQFCFDTFASTSLNYVEINTYSHTSGSLGRNLRFSDPTTRTGSLCQLYTLSTPIVLTSDSGANFFIQVNWAVANSQFAIGRTTFILEPTTNSVSPLSLFNSIVVF